MQIRNENLHEFYFVLKTDIASRARFLSAIQTADLDTIDGEIEAIAADFNSRFPNSPIIDCSQITRAQRLTLIDSMVV